MLLGMFRGSAVGIVSFLSGPSLVMMPVPLAYRGPKILPLQYSVAQI